MKLVVAFILLLFCFNLNAQDIVFKQAKFTTDNNIKFAEKNYDDSKWKSINTNTNYEIQGYENYNGFSWYRMQFNLNEKYLSNSVLKDSIRISLAKIDDCCEVFLNGTLIFKSGNFPYEPSGYVSTWYAPINIVLSTKNENLLWGQTNSLAIKVYDGNGGGGMYSDNAYITMVDVIDGIQLNTDLTNDFYNEVALTVQNKFNNSVDGAIKVLNNKMLEKMVTNAVGKINLKANESKTFFIKLPKHNLKKIDFVFEEQQTKKQKFVSQYIPYILTPAESLAPKINTPSQYGIKPNNPIVYRVPASGQAPLNYSIVNLPEGLSIDNATGVISGKLATAGLYKATIKVSNSLGNAEKPFLINCGDKIVLSPPMGWNSWNCWGLSVSQEKVKSSASALINSGLVNYGWSYINIDDGWEASNRNDDGTITANEKFPNMKALGDWLHDRGLKFGIYSSPGELTCGEFLGSYNHELQDANTYANWGVDFLKYDWCSYNKVHNGDTNLAAFKKPYKVMQQALAAQPRAIAYSLCQYGMRNVWEWGNEVGGNLWRTTGDIEDSWESLYGIGFSQTKQQAYMKPGNYNDPDMMIIGQLGWGDNLRKTRLTPDEQYTHVSLWCLLNAPLLLGCDLSKLDAFTKSLLTNSNLIAINQNVKYAPASPILKTKQYQIWKKMMDDGSFIFGIFNISETKINVEIPINNLGESISSLTNCWTNKNFTTKNGKLSANIDAHSVLLLSSKNF